MSKIMPILILLSTIATGFAGITVSQQHQQSALISQQLASLDARLSRVETLLMERSRLSGGK